MLSDAPAWLRWLTLDSYKMIICNLIIKHAIESLSEWCLVSNHLLAMETAKKKLGFMHFGQTYNLFLLTFVGHLIYVFLLQIVLTLKTFTYLVILFLFNWRNNASLSITWFWFQLPYLDLACKLSPAVYTKAQQSGGWISWSICQ